MSSCRGCGGQSNGANHNSPWLCAGRRFAKPNQTTPALVPTKETTSHATQTLQAGGARNKSITILLRHCSFDCVTQKQMKLSCNRQCSLVHNSPENVFKKLAWIFSMLLHTIKSASL